MDIHNNLSGISAKWDEFVSNSDTSTPYQLSGWMRVFEQTYGIKTFSLSATEEDRIVGVLPLLYVRGKVFGGYLTSMPGGLVAENRAAADALLEHAFEMVVDLDADYLVLRDGSVKYDSPNLITDEGHCSMIVDITVGKDQLQKNVRRTTRQYAKKAKRESVITEVGNEYFDDFYNIYLEAMQQRGTPTQGRLFFDNAISEFPDNFQLMVILHEGEILGGGFVFEFNNRVVCTWSGLSQKYYSMNTSYVFFWDTIMLASDWEAERLDLGRSQKDSGTYRFKKKFGAEPKQLYQQFYLNKISDPPSVGGSRNGTFYYRSFVNLWQVLPISLTEFVGPMLRKRVPFG